MDHEDSELHDSEPSKYTPRRTTPMKKRLLFLCLAGTPRPPFSATRPHQPPSKPMASPTLAGGMGKLAVSDDMLAAAAVLETQGKKQGEAADENKQGETEDMSPLLENFTGLSVSTIPELEAVYDLLIRDHPTSVGKAASTAARQRMGLSLSTLVYGEIMFSSFAIAFEKLRNKYNLLDAGGIFYDIGAGT